MPTAFPFPAASILPGVDVYDAVDTAARGTTSSGRGGSWLLPASAFAAAAGDVPSPTSNRPGSGALSPAPPVLHGTGASPATTPTVSPAAGPASPPLMSSAPPSMPFGLDADSGDAGSRIPQIAAAAAAGCVITRLLWGMYRRSAAQPAPKPKPTSEPEKDEAAKKEAALQPASPQRPRDTMPADGVSGGFTDVGTWGEAASPVSPQPGDAPAPPSPGATRASLARPPHASPPPAQACGDWVTALDGEAPTQAPLGAKGSEWMLVQ